MQILRPFTDVEYATWLSHAIPAYAADKIASGDWSDEAALGLSRNAHEALLPLGKNTPDNYLYSILDEAGIQVGSLWFATQDRGSDRVAFVYDIAIEPRHRRKGYAQRAFKALELEVQTLGLAGIALHVFGHNAAAQALYVKLGYNTADINMFKQLVATGA